MFEIIHFVAFVSSPFFSLRVSLGMDRSHIVIHSPVDGLLPTSPDLGYEYHCCERHGQTIGGPKLSFLFCVSNSGVKIAGS